MSAYQSNTNNNQWNQQYPNMKLDQPGELNENHGIAATGLNDPHFATAPLVQGNAGSRRQQRDDLNYNAPLLRGNNPYQTGNTNMTGDVDDIRAENKLGQTGDMPSGTMYSSTPIGGNTFDQIGTDNASAGINTAPGDQGLVSSGNIDGSNTSFNSQSGRDIYGANTDDLSTHQPKNDVLNSNTAPNTGLKYSGADTDISNVDQSGGFDSNIRSNKLDTGATGATGATGIPGNLNQTGPQSGYTGASGIPGNLDQNGSQSGYTGISGIPGNLDQNGSQSGYADTSGIPGNLDQNGPQSGYTGTSGIPGNLDQNGPQSGYTGTSGIPSTAENTNTQRYDGTNLSPTSNVQDVQHDSKYGDYKNMTAPEGDHGFSHHMQELGKADENAGLNNDPNAVSGVFDDNGMRHAGEPLHDGMGKATTENDHRMYDAEHLGNDQSLGNQYDLAKNAPSTTGEHPLSSDNVEKPSVGDKIKGNLEKMAGKITGDEAKIIKGENIAQGRQ